MLLIFAGVWYYHNTARRTSLSGVSRFPSYCCINHSVGGILKIAEVVATFPPYPGGTGYVCWNNARELARRGHDVSVFTLDFQRLPYNDDPEDITIVRLKTPLLFGGGGMVPQLYCKLKAFDVVHLHYPFYGGAEYVYLSSRLGGKPYVTTYHQDFYGDSYTKKLVIGVYDSLLFSKIIRKSSKVAILSHEHFTNSRVSTLVDRGKVVELPNGVDTEIFAPREKDAVLVKRYGLENKTVILFVGHLLPFKGLHVLLTALSTMNTENVVLFVVGVGASEQEYRKFADEQGLHDRIIFAGYKSQLEELPAYYNTCDFLILPSTGAPESFGMVIIEAMASGKPAVVSALPGPSHLIEDGVDGLLFAIGDSEDLKQKIEYLIQEPDTRSRMGAAARNKVLEHYSWSRIGDRLEKILRDIVR